jgi:hypothetical protein
MTGMNQVDRINYYNILAMLLSASLAIFVPFELTLLSYTVLGPGHYLTELSWLKEKQFFTIKKYDYLIILAIAIVGKLIGLPNANLAFYIFGLSLLFLVIKDSVHRIAAISILIIAGYFLLSNHILRAIFGLYLSTLIHVYIFTGMFLLYGALKSKRISGYLSVVIFVLCPILLMLLFTGLHIKPTAWAVTNYARFSRLNRLVLHDRSINVYTNNASILFTRFIAFAYSYHYLNWFSKTSIINWHRISIKRAIIVILIWGGSIAFYFYNYNTGLQWLFMLSFAHVILEFPLNHRTFIGIGEELKNRLSPMATK